MKVYDTVLYEMWAPLSSRLSCSETPCDEIFTPTAEYRETVRGWLSSLTGPEECSLAG